MRTKLARRLALRALHISPSAGSAIVLLIVPFRILQYSLTFLGDRRDLRAQPNGVNDSWKKRIT